MSQRSEDTGKYISEDYSREELTSHLRQCEREHGKVTRKLVVEDDRWGNRTHFDKEFGSFSQAKEATLKESGYVQLTQQRRDEINQALEDSNYKQEMLIGLLMGDGTIENQEGGNPCLRVGMSNEKFLTWLSGELGDIVSSISLDSTAEEIAQNLRNSGFRPNTKEENCQDHYILNTRRLPWIEYLESWYDTGEKRFPDDLKMTPTIAKMWYCGDGGVNITNKICEIKSSNEKDRPEYLKGLFEQVGFSPSFDNAKLRFSQKESNDLLEWMGSPPPGFDYKWPENFKA